jgi:hypothetical protein
MNKKRFEWLTDDSFTAVGLKLEKGKSYDVDVFGEAIVEEWARTGNARILAAPKAKAAAAGEEA